MLNKNDLKILIIEDDNFINNLIKDLLTKEGYNCSQAFSGTEGKLYFENYTYHLALIDLTLPGLTGEELIPYIRNKSSIPIITITAKTNIDDKVNLLLKGADDYITKPFHTKELLARVEANLRRYIELSNNPKDKLPKITHKNLTLYKASQEVFIKETKLDLTPKEFLILELLLNNKDKVFTKENIFTSIWRGKYFGTDNTVNVHISNIRLKISAIDNHTEYIKTVWGIGFKIST